MYITIWRTPPVNAEKNVQTTSSAEKIFTLEYGRHHPFKRKIICRRHHLQKINFEQIYHVWEGYLRKIQVERRTFLIFSRLGYASTTMIPSSTITGRNTRQLCGLCHLRIWQARGWGGSILSTPEITRSGIPW